jgi:pre-rRNA-processing protein IPI3
LIFYNYNIFKFYSQRLISQENAKAIHTFSGHALPITDIYVGYGLEQARITTVSLDRSCKVFQKFISFKIVIKLFFEMWELTTESLLFSLIYPCALCAVVLDPAESLLFVGGSFFKYQLNLN